MFGTLFEAEHYNGDPIIGEDVGFLFSFNKLIGGPTPPDPNAHAMSP